MKRRTTFGRAAIVGIVLALVAVLAACSSSGSKSGSSSGAVLGGEQQRRRQRQRRFAAGQGQAGIHLGDKNFAEQYLLGALYQKALQAQGYNVTLKGNLGSSEITDKALTSGKIDGYPEYTGVIYTELANLGDRPKSAASTLCRRHHLRDQARLHGAQPDAVPGR